MLYSHSSDTYLQIEARGLNLTETHFVFKKERKKKLATRLNIHRA
jgi:predicted PhzF superfamily epimerase YddE/YHI9